VMSFSERLQNVIRYWSSKLYTILDVAVKRESLYQMFNVTRISLKNTQGLLLVQSVFGFEFPRPIGSHVSFIGPLLPEDPIGPLGDKYQKWLDLSPEKNVILISLGSAVYSDEYMVRQMSITFKTLSQQHHGKKLRFLWKLRDDSIQFLPADLDPNVVFVDKWIPQNDLLYNPKIIGFVAHGGMNGVFESIFHGVPMVCIPFFGDQPDNCVRVQASSSGLYLSPKPHIFNNQSFTDAIIQISQNSTFKDSVAILSGIVRDSGRTEEAVKKIEFVIKFGHQSLVNWRLWEMHWYELYSLDVYYLIFTVFQAVFIAFPFLFCYCCCCRKRSSPLLSQNQPQQPPKTTKQD